MAQKRTAHEAFGRPKSLGSGFASASETGQLSAVAAAKLARHKDTVAVAEPLPEPSPENLATAIGGLGYDGHHAGTSTPVEQAVDDAPRPAQSRRAPVQLSSFKQVPRTNSTELADELELTLNANETATIVGEYDVCLQSGVATVYGTVLRPDSGRLRVLAPSTQALPQMQARQDDTVVRVSPVRFSLRKLEKLSPLFRNIWAADGRSFSLLNSSDEDALQRSLSPLEVGKDMDLVLRTLSAKVMVEPHKPRIMAVGAKSSGKSTFNRILCNHIQSWTPEARCQYLDLDPGQPEFGPPGQVSLVEVARALLGPAFTHFAERDAAALRLVRSHTIAATTFKHDPDHYRNCALDLAKRADTSLPLVVNTCGWINGLGASILTELVSILQITDLVLLEPVDGETVEPIQSSATEASIYRIPRQAPKPSPRTPAEQRAMQTMAYFHHRKRSGEGSESRGKPIGTTRPYIVSFAGEEQSILAIASYGQSPKPEFLAEVLDGSVVAVVVLDSGHRAAFEGAVDRIPEGLPYLVPNADGTTRTIDPQYSSCIGLALVRCIDWESQQLELTAPLHEDEMAALAGTDVILVRGSFDAPEWAYLEDLYLDNLGDEDIHERPWVSKREMVGIEGAVWRLRHPPLAPSVASSR